MFQTWLPKYGLKDTDFTVIGCSNLINVSETSNAKATFHFVVKVNNFVDHLVAKLEGCLKANGH